MCVFAYAFRMLNKLSWMVLLEQEKVGGLERISRGRVDARGTSFDEFRWTIIQLVCRPFFTPVEGEKGVGL